MPGRPDVALASMGIYVFNPRLLERLLRADAEDPDSAHDFGKNIIPQAIENLRVFAYPFEDVRSKAQHYWRDVGTIDAYYEANMELVRVSPELNIYDEQWPIWTYQEQLPPAKFVFDDDNRRGCAIDSMVSGGCIISGSRVSNSLLFSQVRVHDYSTVDRSVILPRVRIGENCVIRNAIIDEGAVVPDGTHDRRRSRAGPRALLRQRERRYARHGVDAARPGALAAAETAGPSSHQGLFEGMSKMLLRNALLRMAGVLAVLAMLAGCSTCRPEARVAGTEPRRHPDDVHRHVRAEVQGARAGQESRTNSRFPSAGSSTRSS